MAGKRARLTKSMLQGVVFLAVSALASTSTPAQERLLVPEQSLSGPFYARIERAVILQTDEWVAIPFYREPACVRAGFNLLNFFDFANIPGIFFCPLTVSGFELWDDPASDAAPRQSQLQGNGAVPVWFVSVDDFQAALPGLTMTELLAMPSLMQGVATSFHETLHPLEGAQQTMLQIGAAGYLPDGRSFDLQATEAGGGVRNVRIEFR